MSAHGRLIPLIIRIRVRHGAPKIIPQNFLTRIRTDDTDDTDGKTLQALLLVGHFVSPPSPSVKTKKSA
jgi:hypothetical protein